MKKFLLYLLRWQCSTPILAIVAILLAECGYWASAIIADLIGGMLFFWVDKYIFSERKGKRQRNVQE